MSPRDLRALDGQSFDIVVVGGGIFGLCLAREAAARGLTVALVERGDFAAATSAHSFKMVHGGIRYLQHADLPRIRESVAERRTLLRIAPHLVRPLPILIPTYGHGLRGQAVLGAGMLAYELLTLDKNRGIRDPARRIPPPRRVSARECLRLFPPLESRGLTGGFVFHDGQMYNPPRLGLAFLRSAMAAGARAANYVEATGFLVDRGRVAGVRARDLPTGSDLEIRGRLVINAAGPWAESLLDTLPAALPRERSVFSRDACFVVTRALTSGCAVTIPGATQDPDAWLSRGARHLFLVPWRSFTLVGVWHVVHQGRPGDFTVTREEIQGFIDEVRSGCPTLALSIDDVSRWNAGLVLFGQNTPGARHLSYGKRSRVLDHRADGVPGLMTVIGVRYTTAHGVARRVIDRALDAIGRTATSSATTDRPVFGGDFESFERLEREAAAGDAADLRPEVRTALLSNYGARYGDVVRLARGDRRLASPIAGSTTLRAEVLHAVREEMALTLADIVLRRTDLATGAWPGEGAVREAAGLAAPELGWDAARTDHEIDAVRRSFAGFAAAPPAGRRG